jgi:catechol 2,3-dioxygenase-like lactoylglutathione lyase family enzyme
LRLRHAAPEQLAAALSYKARAEKKEETSTMQRVKIVGVLVKDYDAALEFYSQKLGFGVVEDIPAGDRRWITLSLPGNGCALALELAKDPDDLAVVGRQAGSFPLLALDTSDCLGDYEMLKARGVIFHGEPEAGPWGTGVLLEDLYGNKLFVSQES